MYNRRRISQLSHRWLSRTLQQQPSLSRFFTEIEVGNVSRLPEAFLRSIVIDHSGKVSLSIVIACVSLVELVDRVREKPEYDRIAPYRRREI